MGVPPPPPGDSLTATPSISSWGKNRLDLFVQGRVGGIWHRWFNDRWHDWERLEDVRTWGPVAISWKTPLSTEDTDFPRIDVFARAADNTLYHKWFSGGKWRRSELLPGELTSSPAVASWGYGRLDVVYRGTDNALWHRSFNGTNWSGEEPLGGVLTSDPAAVSWGHKRIDVFARGTDNALWQKTFDGHWNDWNPVGGALTSAPAVASRGSNQLDVFYRGTDNALWHRSFSSGGWSGEEPLGGNLESSPSAVSRSSNRIDVFSQNRFPERRILYGRIMWDGVWHDWEPWFPPHMNERPLPSGFEISGDFNANFEHWGHYTTSYSSTGFIGTSQRWDNSDMESTNMIAGFQFKIGPDASKIWKDDPGGLEPRVFMDRDPPVVLYFPRAVLTSHKRGSYILQIRSHVDNSPSFGAAIKELPHPKYGEAIFNTEDPKPDIGNIRDGKWHAFLAAVYNHPHTNVPTMKLWYNANATQDFADYVYLGSSVDSHDKPMSPGPPMTLNVEGIDHLFKIEHPLRIRIDNIPREQLEIRDLYAAKVFPRIPKPVEVCPAEFAAFKEAEGLVNEKNEEIKRLQAQLHGDVEEGDPEMSKRDILREIQRIKREELPPLKAQLEKARRLLDECRERH